MKILLIARLQFDLPAHKGVAQKVKSQQNALMRLGHDCDLIYLRIDGIYLNSTLVHPIAINEGVSSKFYFFSRLFHDIQKVIKDRKYDLLYIRYPMTTPDFLWFLKKRHRLGEKIILEMPTYPYKMEKTGFLSSSVLKVDQLLSGKLKKYVNYITHLGTDHEIYGIPTIPFNNAVEIEAFPLKKSLSFEGKLKLLAVGNITEFQGFDRAILGLMQYKKTIPEIEITVVGEGEYLPVLKQIAASNKLNVRFLGSVFGQELDKLFDSHHLAIGKLGIHRAQFDYSSSLKHREYMARGMAFVYSGKDSSIEQCNHGFALRLPDNDEPIDYENLLPQLEEMIKISPLEIRNKVRNNIGWEREFNNILSNISDKF
ncbi:MAG TPA: hypothetical protein PK147_05845 [Saprospiraceae bacterium]|nr:glycosyltransferase family 4 protein [Saprospiraceae bacterium]HPK09133.1 hypothetical protein [Saprospiraceae bacterium]HPQ21352.1 hypothetical protein [Saprospiraceae bacterium]